MSDFGVGWHPEPGNPRREGYWDGLAWTGEWREAGAFLSPLPPSPTPAEVRALRVDHSTGPAWLIATSPLWLFAIGFGVVLFSFVSALASAGIVVGIVAILVSGFLDRSLLRKRGIADTASPLWGFLGPLAYLITRHLALRSAPGTKSTVLQVFVVSTALILTTLAIMIGVSSTIGSMLRVLYPQ
jgi:hypothetical protein